jgi:hypothetical protein
MTTFVQEIANYFQFPLDRPWSNLTEDERDGVERAMSVYSVNSVNGPAGYHLNLRRRHERSIEGR